MVVAQAHLLSGFRSGGQQPFFTRALPLAGLSSLSLALFSPGSAHQASDAPRSFSLLTSATFASCPGLLVRLQAQGMLRGTPCGVRPGSTAQKRQMGPSGHSLGVIPACEAMALEAQVTPAWRFERQIASPLSLFLSFVLSLSFFLSFFLSSLPIQTSHLPTLTTIYLAPLVPFHGLFISSRRNSMPGMRMSRAW
jgi:hypothetical protein